MTSTTETKADRFAEQLYRIAEFRKYVNTNVLFPHVPDAIIHPLLEQLGVVEDHLVVALFRQHALEKAIAVYRMLDLPMPKLTGEY